MCIYITLYEHLALKFLQMPTDDYTEVKRSLWYTQKIS